MPAGTTVLHCDDAKTGLTLLGLIGLIDTPRPEAIAAVADCRQAGIRVVMITGDNSATALGESCCDVLLGKLSDAVPRVFIKRYLR